ncbi:MAG: exodeoxyribonuclease VII large subunit [Anaerolineae bacterium]|nr:exodeoxyribonuclease VII large subunit [Anaerolineae bacterium]
MFEQLDLFNGPTLSAPYTVSQLTGVIRRLIESRPELSDLWVEGEVSNFSRASSGHCYFTLKDAGSQLNCVMWRGAASKQSYLPTTGDQVQVHGYVGVYEAGGRYQLYADEIQPAGIGDLYRQFELLKARLENEALFAPERKRQIPQFPRVIGVVTSPTAAALRDIVNVLSRRYPLARVLLSPTAVQGDAAPPQIVAALDALNARDDVDVIIVARGGGSLEDLWAFNDEGVARAIAASRHPVVCGVGHETDFSLADFVADLRAPTPSAAAELVVQDQFDLRAQVVGLAVRATSLLHATLDGDRLRLTEQERALRHLSPGVQIAQARQHVDDLLGRSQASVGHEFALWRERLAGVSGRLAGFSPVGTLARGYAIVRHSATGDVVSSVQDVSAGDLLAIRVLDGEFDAEVTS